jgi:hypothetical protein
VEGWAEKKDSKNTKLCKEDDVFLESPENSMFSAAKFLFINLTLNIQHLPFFYYFTAFFTYLLS